MQNHVDFIASKIKPGSTWVSAQELFQIIDSNFRYSPNDLVKLGLLLRKAGISSARKKINGVKLTMYQVTTPKIGQ